jgi:hypothetical protein
MKVARKSALKSADFLRHNHEDLCEAYPMTNLLEQAISCDDGRRRLANDQQRQTLTRDL